MPAPFWKVKAAEQEQDPLAVRAILALRARSGAPGSCNQ